MTSKHIAIKAYRPDLRWIEALLGESLQMPAEPPLDGSINPDCDTNAIPQGPYCYDVAASYRHEHVPCPYFRTTDHDSVICDCLGIEAADGLSEKLAAHFGGRDQAVAAGVIETYTLPDSIKECGLHLALPATVENLQYRMDDYEQALFGKHRDEWDQPFYTRRWDQPTLLREAVIARYAIWEALCGMTEDVPPSLIQRLQEIDAMLRAHTEPTDTIIDKDFFSETKGFISPENSLEKQFWYLYRKNFVCAANTGVRVPPQ
jgi:hypothetical protein